MKQRGNGPGGFTLIELMISVTVAAMILGAAYGTLNAGFASQKLVEPRLDAIQNGRVAMAMLTADLRGACPLSADDDFLGAQRKVNGAEADNLDFGTHNFTPNRPRQGDFCQVSYYVEKDRSDGELTLWRRRNPMFALNPVRGDARADRAGTGLGAVRILRRIDWYDTWGNVNHKTEKRATPLPNDSGLPTAVRITLAVRPSLTAKKTPGESNSEPPLVFRTVAPLEWASMFQSSSSSGGSSGNNPQ